MRIGKCKTCGKEIVWEETRPHYGADHSDPRLDLDHQAEPADQGRDLWAGLEQGFAAVLGGSQTRH